MAIKLQDLTSELHLDSKGFQAGANVALAGIGALVAGVAAVAAGIGVMVKATFEWAGEMDSLGDVMDGTNKEIAAYTFLARKSGVGTDKLAKGITILNKGLVKADGTLDTIGKELQKFGINVLDANNKVRSQSDLMSDISKKYSSFATQQEKVNFLTGIFGKSGADLIDLFDTMAAEGGIDAVTKKVEALGLAIDPAKYEQFQRNLEEVKLAGLGLAVTIVDSLMPAFEGASKWWVDTGLPAFMDMKAWLDVNIPIAIDTSKKAWEGMGVTWTTNVSPALAELVRLWENLSAIATKLDPQVGEISSKFTILGATQRVAVAWATTVNWGLSLVTLALKTLNIALETTIPQFLGSLSRFGNEIRQRLDAISQAFREKAQSWINQAVQSFSNGKDRLLDEIRSIVTAVNAILKKIITSFTLSFNVPDFLSGLFGGSGGRTGAKPKPRKKAVGGNVSAGQLYNVAELGRPEYFIPAMNGRVEPERSEQAKEIRLDRHTIREIARANKELVLKGA